jgi:hypothetical protein
MCRDWTGEAPLAADLGKVAYNAAVEISARLKSGALIGDLTYRGDPEKISYLERR